MGQQLPWKQWELYSDLLWLAQIFLLALHRFSLSAQPFWMRCLHPNPWDLWICYITKGRIKIEDGQKVANQLTLKWRDYRHGSSVIPKVLRRERGKPESVPEWCSMRKAWPVISGSDGRGSWAKECWQPLEAGKGEEMDSFLRASRGMQPCDTFSSGGPISDFWPAGLEGNKCVLF